MDTPRWKDSLPDYLHFDRDVVPFAITEGLDRYFTDHIPTGGFLRAVLENDLAGAITRADPLNLAALEYIVHLVRDGAPPGSWGTPHKVDAWIRNSPGGERRESGVRINEGDE